MEAKPDLLNLDLEAEMIARVGSSLKRVKKRLVDADLTFQLMPPPDADPLEVSTWEAKIHALIGHRDTMSFPQLLDFKRAFSERQRVEQQQQQAVATALSDKHAERLKKGAQAAARLQQMQANKTFGVTSNFGGKVPGEPLRTIEDYCGQNTIYNHQPRTLVRRDGRFTKVRPSHFFWPSCLVLTCSCALVSYSRNCIHCHDGQQIANPPSLPPAFTPSLPHSRPHSCSCFSHHTLLTITCQHAPPLYLNVPIYPLF